MCRHAPCIPATPLSTIASGSSPVAALNRLPELQRKVRELEEQLEKLKTRS